MDNMIDQLENELKKAQSELNEVKKSISNEIAKAKAESKAAVSQALAQAYADGMRKALAELEQPLQKQRKALAAAEAAIEKAGKVIAVKVPAAKKSAAVKSVKKTAPAVPVSKAPETGKKMTLNVPATGKLTVNAPTSAKKSATTATKPVAPSGSLHEKRLGILEREFNPPLKSAQADAALESTATQDFASLDDILNKGDWS
ncbi:MAG: hypothetical protein K0R48_761 [Gammaproteobacteria bacterium]|jgi:seryl-tRNA synthetase|nr:hypothetical protein [Gammaproteobacteria bacterium]